MNTPDHWETVAIIQNPERKEFWKEVFGGDRAPIKSIFMRRADLPGHKRALIYELDLAALSAQQRASLVLHISKQFGYTVREVEADLDTQGMPILASDVIVSSSDSTSIALLN